MRYRIIAALALLAFSLNVFGAVLTRSEPGASLELAKLLPESDGVLTLDASRVFNSALPEMLSANQKMLTKITTKLDQIKDETGLDLRKFNDVAVGVKTKSVSDDDFELEPVILARGDVESQSVVSVARLVSNGEYQTEKVGDRTVYIFSVKEILDKNKPKKKAGDKNLLEKAIGRMFDGLSNEIALTIYDEKTVALGTLPRVKELLGATPRVSSDVLSLLGRKPQAMANLGALLPSGISRFVKLGDDELGETLDSIREMQGSLDVNDGQALLSIMARTLGTKQAESLESTLSGLRMLGKAVLGNSKNADKQVYARMVENAQISRSENTVMLDLAVPKSDIDTLVGKN